MSRTIRLASLLSCLLGGCTLVLGGQDLLTGTDGDAGPPDRSMDAGSNARPDAGAGVDAMPDTPPDLPAPACDVAECPDDDGIECTMPFCDGDECALAAVNSLCDDGIACTDDTCMLDVGCVHLPVHERCDDDDNPCTDAVCSLDAGCQQVDDDENVCDDGDDCTRDECESGTCLSTALCGGDTVCDPSTGICLGCVEDADCPRPEEGAWSECAAEDTCALSGRRTRVDRVYHCASSGRCEYEMRPIEETCSRATDALECRPTEWDAFGACERRGECNSEGTERRAGTRYTCSAGACEGTRVADMRPCRESTDGQDCGTDRTDRHMCVWADACASTAAAGEDIAHDFYCEGDRCVDHETRTAASCSRTTEGTACGTGGSCQSGSCCEPRCSGRECGPDGCGGTRGGCGAGQACNASGRCACAPRCSLRECGSDGCGGTCGSCASPETCNSSGRCECVPQCSGRECGSDGCGGTCGSCPSGQACSAAGQCECVPQCSGRECGSDGCGGTCGSCASGETCDASGQCQCVPQCRGRECGSDGCGGTCGRCPSGQACFGGECGCVPNCRGRECGSDGCGGSCGTCRRGLCNSAGMCGGIIACTCGSRECGEDSCGRDVCGSCPIGQFCSSAGSCVRLCPPPPRRCE